MNLHQCGLLLLRSLDDADVRLVGEFEVIDGLDAIVLVTQRNPVQYTKFKRFVVGRHAA